MKKTILAVLFLATAVSAQDKKPQKAYKLYNLSDSEVIVTCKNGGDPTFKKLSGTSLIISCGATLKAEWDGRKFICPKGTYVWPEEKDADSKDNLAYCGDHPLS